MTDTQDLLKELPVAVYTTDASGALTFYNDAAAQLWGQRPELGSMWCGSWRIYTPDGQILPHDECPMAVAIKEKRKVRGVEAVAERPDGTRVPFIPYPTPLFDKEGTLIGGLNVLVDIGERKNRDIAAARLAAVVKSSDDAIVSKTLNGTITSWNEGATRIFGYTEKEMIGQNITKLIPAERLEEEKMILAKLAAGEHIGHFETVRVAKNGRRIDVSLTISPIRDESGKIVGASKVGRDITEAKQAALIQARLAAIVASSDDAIISKTLDGIVTSWNDAATRIFEFTPAEMIGQPILKVIPPELHQEEKEILARLRAGEHIGHYETVRMSKSRRRIDISLTISPLRNAAGQVVGASKVARDISERKQHEKLQQLLMEELNHRVKNTLATVQAIATQSSAHAKSQGDFVNSFTGRVQALAKAHTLLTQTRMQGAELSEIIREQVLLGGFTDNRVAISGPSVMLDAQEAVHLALVLHELATNARKYGALSVPRGQVSVSWDVRADTKRALLLSWREQGGPKISVPQARGFGTQLIEQTIRGHEGSYTVNYGVDGLSCHIELPLSADLSGLQKHAGAREERMLDSKDQAPSTLKGKRILIVEDEPLLAMDLESTLQRLGCTVAGPASSIDMAKRLIEAEEFDAALVDVNLGGKPADEIAAALVQKNVPFAFVTGYGRKALPAGFQDAVMLTKPFNESQLTATVETLLYLARPKSGVITLRPKKV